MLNTFLTSILYFILLNWTHYQFYKNAPVTLDSDIVPLRWRSDEFEEIGSEVVEAEEVRPSSSTRWTILVPCYGLVSFSLLTFVEIVLRSLQITIVCREISTSVWC